MKFKFRRKKQRIDTNKSRFLQKCDIVKCIFFIFYEFSYRLIQSNAKKMMLLHDFL